MYGNNKYFYSQNGREVERLSPVLKNAARLSVEVNRADSNHRINAKKHTLTHMQHKPTSDII